MLCCPSNKLQPTAHSAEGLCDNSSPRSVIQIGDLHMETSFVPTNSLLRPSAMASPPPACGTIPHTVLTTFGVSNRGTLHSASTSSAPDLRRHFSLSHSPPNSESQPSQSTCSSLAPVGNRPIKSYQSPEQRDQEVCESLSLLHRQQATLEEQKKAFADVISKLSNICSELKTLSQSLKQTAENLSESQTTAIASTFRAELRAYYEKLEERLRPLTAPVDSSEPSLSQILSQVESSFGHISQIFIERWAHFEQQQKAAFDLLLKDISHSLQQCSQHRQCSALQTQNSQSSSSSSAVEMFEEMTLWSNTECPPKNKGNLRQSSKSRRGYSKRTSRVVSNKRQKQEHTTHCRRITPKYEKIITRAARRKFEQQLGIESEQQQQQQQQQQQKTSRKDKRSRKKKAEIPSQGQAEEEANECLSFNVASLFSK